MKHEEYLWGAIYNKMFHLKSLVSYYRDLLFCLYCCLKLRNRDLCHVSGKESALRLVFLPKVECTPQLREESWLTVTLTALAAKAKDPGEWDIRHRSRFDAPLTSCHICLAPGTRDWFHSYWKWRRRCSKSLDPWLSSIDNIYREHGPESISESSRFQNTGFSNGCLELPANKCHMISVKPP